MTPYKKFYYYIIMVFEPFLFLVRKRNASPKKKYCSLRSPTAPRGARPRSFHHEAWLHDEKSPVIFPLTLCSTVKKDAPSSN